MSIFGVVISLFHKVLLLIFGVVILGVLTLGIRPSFALYPDKSSYSYEKTNLDVYLSLTFATAVSETFGSWDKGHYKPLYSPVNLLDRGLFSGAVGIRFFDNKDTFFNNFRIESEWQYLYEWYPVLSNPTIYKNDIDASKFPNKGQEVLKEAFAMNLYYDIRHFSEILYPYIGIGIGVGKVKYLWVDTEMLPNGMGQQYHGEKRVPYTQIMLGLEYDLKIIKSSFFVQYKFVTSGAVPITPYNPGDNNFQDPSTPLPPGYTPPKQEDKRLMFHTLGFGFKYYFY